MITAFVLLMLFFMTRMTVLAFKATWSITKWIICLFVCPVVLISLVIAGLAVFALPLLILALLASIFIPFLKGFASAWK